MNQELWPLKKTAKYLNISDRTIYNRISRNAEKPFPIKPVRVGRKVMFRYVDIEKFINSYGEK
jgi:predicted DNA-binding transcriptional regulator AlpA